VNRSRDPERLVCFVLRAGPKLRADGCYLSSTLISRASPDVIQRRGVFRPML